MIKEMRITKIINFVNYFIFGENITHYGYIFAKNVECGIKPYLSLFNGTKTTFNKSKVTCPKCRRNLGLNPYQYRLKDVKKLFWLTIGLFTGLLILILIEYL